MQQEEKVVILLLVGPGRERIDAIGESPLTIMETIPVTATTEPERHSWKVRRTPALASSGSSGSTGSKLEVKEPSISSRRGPS